MLTLGSKNKLLAIPNPSSVKANNEVFCCNVFKARPGQVYRLKIHKFESRHQPSNTLQPCLRRLVVSDGADVMRATTHEIALCDDSHLLEHQLHITSLHHVVSLFFMGFDHSNEKHARFLVEFQGLAFPKTAIKTIL